MAKNAFEPSFNHATGTRSHAEGKAIHLWPVMPGCRPQAGAADADDASLRTPKPRPLMLMIRMSGPGLGPLMSRDARPLGVVHGYPKITQKTLGLHMPSDLFVCNRRWGSGSMHWSPSSGWGKVGRAGEMEGGLGEGGLGGPNKDFTDGIGR